MRLIVEPLDDATWPGTIRTPSERIYTTFTASWKATLHDLDFEVDMTANGGKFHTPAVLEVPFDRSQFYVDGSGVRADSRNPRHPGVALSFDIDGVPFRLAIDRYKGRAGGHGYLPDWQSNVRAISLTLHALRAVDRYGATTTNQQYQGWQALGAGVPMGAGMSIDEAAELLSAESIESPLSGRRVVDLTDLLDLVTRSEATQMAYRIAAKKHHPDAGGDPESFRLLVEARDLLLNPPGAAP